MPPRSSPATSSGNLAVPVDAKVAPGGALSGAAPSSGGDPGVQPEVPSSVCCLALLGTPCGCRGKNPSHPTSTIPLYHTPSNERRFHLRQT